MKVRDLMTKNPACASPDMDLCQVARLMADHNVGSIPVVESGSQRVIGMVTDRDIATRAVAERKNPLEMRAEEIMSSPVVTVEEDADVEEVARLMQDRQVRRVPVVDQYGNVRGMVAQADIALKASDQTTADVVESISQPTKEEHH
jgi:CBS domain-containing protein